MGTQRSIRSLISTIMAIVFLLSLAGNVGAASLAQDPPPINGSSQIEVISPYYSIEHLTTADGTQLTGHIINGPSRPLPEFEAERQALMTDIVPEGTLADFPSYDWVFGCSAVSGAMIAAWYDRGAYPNLYTGPTNGGVMPITDTSWSTWTDGFVTYPNNPLIASHSGLDGRTTKGSIDDYWISYGSGAQDPYMTGGWTPHTWGDAIGDYMKTSQYVYNNTDGSTHFYTWYSSAKLTCADMVSNDVDHLDGTYGRKLFYEAHGYTVTDCYNQNTDNNYSGGFSLANFQAEIDAGHPVLLNLAGHSIVGYGYNGSTIYIRDTWDSDPSHTYTMQWGGSYEGMELQSVSVVKLSPTHGTTSKVFLPLIQKPAAPPPTNPFLNPGFEEGAVSWSQSSTGGWDLIMPTSETPVDAHSGSWLAWLGGANDEQSELWQNITISAAAPYLHFWYWVASEETSCNYDYFHVSAYYNEIFTLGLCEANETGGWVHKVLNLSAYVGTGKTVWFCVTTDGSLNSNVFLDDVSMTASATMMQLPASAVEHYPGAALEGK